MRGKEKKMSREEAIEILSDMRAEYNLFGDEEEATRYHVLSWAIQAMKDTQMGDLIDRKETIRAWCKLTCGCEPEECGMTIEGDGAEECNFVEFLWNRPEYEYERDNEFVPVKHGWWIDDCTCSICNWIHEDSKGFALLTNYPFCPNCGTKMDEVER